MRAKIYVVCLRRHFHFELMGAGVENSHRVGCGVLRHVVRAASQAAW